LKTSGHKNYLKREKNENFFLSLYILKRRSNRMDVSLTGLIHQIIIIADTIKIDHPGIGVKKATKPNIPRKTLNINLMLRGQFMTLR